MFDITNNNIITLTRGDTAETTLVINIGTELEPILHELSGDECVFFGLMEPSCSFEDAILKKVFTKDDVIIDDGIPYVHIIFNTEDTELLLPGVYYYSIKLYRPANSEHPRDLVDTIIPRKSLSS